MPKRRKIQMGPTQKDIADALGVSQSTVAVALGEGNEGKLMVETVAKIREYAAKIGYRPQRFAQIMRGDRTRVVGVAVRLGVYSSNHELIKRLANALNRAGYRLVMVDLQWFDEDPEAVKNYLLDQGVEGVIFCNLVLRTQAQALRALFPEALPFLSLNSSLENVPNLRVDTVAAFHQLTRYHLALGSRKLSLLSMFRDPGAISRPDWTIWDRVSGFVRGIQEVGGIVVVDEAARELLEIPGCRERCPEGFEGIVGEVIYPEKEAQLKNAYGHGFHQTLRLTGRIDRPDSLICANDDSALGALAACADRGLRVPEDLRISGYDDTPAGQFGMVPLTTVRKPLDELANRAVATILACIQHPEKCREGLNEFLPGEIVVRRSTGTLEENSGLRDQHFFASENGCFEFLPEQERGEQLIALSQSSPNSPQQQML